MDTLSKLISDYNHQVVDSEQLLYSMNELANLEDYAQNYQQSLIINKLSTITTKIYSETPEDVLVERERKREILQMIQKVREIIGDKEFKIFCWWVVYNRKQEWIGKQLGINQPAVSKRLKRIHLKIKKHGIKYPIFKRIYEGNNLVKFSLKEAHAPKHTVGFPFDFLKNVCVSGHWHTCKNGRRTFISKTECRLPEYFRESFGDDQTVCGLCKKCARE